MRIAGYCQRLVGCAKLGATVFSLAGLITVERYDRSHAVSPQFLKCATSRSEVSCALTGSSGGTLEVFREGGKNESIQIEGSTDAFRFLLHSERRLAVPLREGFLLMTWEDHGPPRAAISDARFKITGTLTFPNDVRGVALYEMVYDREGSTAWVVTRTGAQSGYWLWQVLADTGGNLAVSRLARVKGWAAALGDSPSSILVYRPGRAQVERLVFVTRGPSPVVASEDISVSDAFPRFRAYVERSYPQDPSPYPELSVLLGERAGKLYLAENYTIWCGSKGGRGVRSERRRLEDKDPWLVSCLVKHGRCVDSKQVTESRELSSAVCGEGSAPGWSISGRGILGNELVLVLSRLSSKLYFEPTLRIIRIPLGSFRAGRGDAEAETGMR
jgi:hypothetical protein